MKRGLVAAGAILVACLYTWASFSWFEAEREVRVLCSGFRGDDLGDVVNTLATGQYLAFAPTATPAGLEIWSSYTLVAGQRPQP
jgi:hypothetical protein